MIQEAVLEERQGDRYIGFLIEEEEWHGLETINGDVFEDVQLGHSFKWRVVDRLTGNTTEGPIPLTNLREVKDYFERTWRQFANSPYRPPEPEVPVVPVDPYASHPNYGRF
ncbi:hypothetical protein EVB78_146 [Rhizobium phage RHph_N1_15]|nr:hypothetical protein EVB77_146 [Rhizobium phage RHph_N1_10]QIG69348.1 hypothetical protein EVB78_146 [Rhizobium phage RHph_N1_15]QIG75208.1 hypothetical protein EVC15_146 [Rhizobium phage RHph_N2_6]